jgi:excisionase family DNA binding protein
MPTAEGRPATSRTLLTPAEVARIFHVDPKTVARWAREGRVSSLRTLGGHHRYLRTEIEALLDGRSGSPDRPS